MPLIDLHCDTVTECLYKNAHLRENGLHIDLLKLKRADVMLQCFAAFIPTHAAAEEVHVTEAPYDFYKRVVAFYREELAANAALIAPVTGFDDIGKNRAAGKISALLTVEDAGAVIDGRPERMEELYNDGVRLITLTWNYENCLGYPNSREPGEMKKGLKPFGIDMLACAEELGMTVDVSHLSEGGFWDVVKHAKKPFVASHSDCRTLCGHPRNLTDEMLKALADKGGVAGANYYDPFLTDGGMEPVTPERVVDHIAHMVKIAGEDTPALGSDYDGIDGTVLSWKDAAGTPALIEAMEKRGFSAGLIEKVCCKNALRVLKETIG